MFLKGRLLLLLPVQGCSPVRGVLDRRAKPSVAQLVWQGLRLPSQTFGLWGTRGGQSSLERNHDETETGILRFM